MSTVMPDGDTEFVEFWNEILVPKFIQYKHILVGGLSHHSEKIFPSLNVNEGDTFGFYVLSIDDQFGSATATIRNFHGPVPEPTTLAFTAIGLGVWLTTRRRLA